MKAIETKEGRREPEREPRNSRQKAMHDDRMEEVTAEENPRRALGEDSAARAEVLLAALARRAGSLPRLAALGRARVDAALCAGAQSPVRDPIAAGQRAGVTLFYFRPSPNSLLISTTLPSRK